MLNSHREPRKSLARQLIGLIVLMIAVGLVSQLALLARAFAGNLQNAPLIFDVRKSLPLDPAEPVYHDFYINAGADAGFKKGWIFNVVRVISVHDPIQNKQQGELQVNVARLQVLQVAPSMTVARLISEFTDEERPALDFESVMIGDRVDLSTLAAEPAVKPATKKKVAKAVKEETADVEVVAEVKPAAPEIHSEVHTTSSSSAATAPASAAPPTSVQPAQVASPQTSAPVVENASPVAKSPDMVRVPVPASPAAGKL